MRTIVLDTNVFIAAGFNPRSHARRIIEAVRRGEFRMVWNDATRRETKRIIDQIPPLDWQHFADLFQADNLYDGQTHPGKFDFVTDPDDRKFAALAAAAGAVLVTQDRHLLDHRDRGEVTIRTTAELLA